MAGQKEKIMACEKYSSGECQQHDLQTTSVATLGGGGAPDIVAVGSLLLGSVPVIAPCVLVFPGRHNK